MAFASSYPGAAGPAIKAGLRKRGLRQTLRHDPCCIFQWAPYSRTSFQRALGGEMVVSSYFVHKALVRKSDLFDCLLRFCAAADDAAGSGSTESTMATADSMGTADSDSDAATKAAGGDTNNRPGPSGLPSDLALGRAARRALRNLRRAVPVTHCGDLASDPEFLLRTVRAIYGPGGEGGAWILKASNVNNAEQVYAFASLDVAEAVVGRIVDASPSVPSGGKGPAKGGSSWVVQEYIDRPLLLRGRKFHIRVNVLAVGSLALYVHEEMVFHIATEAYDTSDLSRQWQHITNHSVQRNHPDYSLDDQVCGFHKFREMVLQEHPDEGPSRCDQLFTAVCDVVVGTFQAAATMPARGKARPSPQSGGDTSISGGDISGASERSGDARSGTNDGNAGEDKPEDKQPQPSMGRPGLWPLANSFEVFGYDFMIEESDFALRLLEVNEGPALEGLCDPMLCARIVEDTLALVADPWLGHIVAAPPHPPHPPLSPHSPHSPLGLPQPPPPASQATPPALSSLEDDERSVSSLSSPVDLNNPRSPCECDCDGTEAHGTGRHSVCDIPHDTDDTKGDAGTMAKNRYHLVRGRFVRDAE